MDVLESPPPAPDERVAYGSDPNQFAELRRGAGPLIVCIHGGFWRAKYDLAHLGHLCAALTREGFTTWSLEYRRVGQRGGGVPGTLDDVLRGTEQALRVTGAREAIALGHSAGGHLALWLASQMKLRGVVALAPVGDLVEAARLHLGDGAAIAFAGEELEAASPRGKLPLRAKLRLVHGADDDTVPLAMSEQFVAAARAAGDDATLDVLHGMGHFEPIDPSSAAWPRVLAAATGV